MNGKARLWVLYQDAILLQEELYDCGEGRYSDYREPPRIYKGAGTEVPVFTEEADALRNQRFLARALVSRYQKIIGDATHRLVNLGKE